MTSTCPQCRKPFEQRARRRRFCSRLCSNRAKSKGGLSFKDGRWQVRLRDGGWQFYSKCLMEAHLGRHLDPSTEQVHHVNEDKADDRIENLEILTPAAHTELHRDMLTAGLRAVAKLSREDVAYIKASTERTSVLARRFNVTEGAITYHRGAFHRSGILKGLGRG